MSRVLLVGWDAADWRIIDKLLARNEMPHLAALLANGARASIATIQPPLSPMVWTSIATGKRPVQHGILGFTEPTGDGLGLRPIGNLARTAKAIWNILNQNDKRSLVVGWWPSHPAEPIAGAMVSDLFPLDAAGPAGCPMPQGTVHPPGLAGALASLRVHASEITAEMLAMFVPDWQRIDQTRDRSLYDLAGIVAETLSIHNAATDLLARERFDFAAVYYAGIDHFSHRFMRYHAGKRRTAGDPVDPAILRPIVANAYRWHDAMLGRLIALAGPECAVMVVSDHGFHSDAMLPDHIPAEAAGPAVEHRDLGIFCLRAPGVPAGQVLHGASVLDIAPTLLHLFGLPAGADMDGKVLVNAFSDRTLPPRIPSWENVPGPDGRHDPETRHDGAAAADQLRQLIDLGYIAPPGADAAAAVRDCLAENRYNLARSHLDAGETEAAAGILRTLAGEDNEQIRYHRHLIHALVALGQFPEAIHRLDLLDAAATGIDSRAAAELNRRRAERPDRALSEPDAPSHASPGRDPAVRREQFERRVLAGKVGGFATERMLLRCTVLLAQGRKEDHETIRPILSALAARPRWRRALALFLAESFAAIGMADRAMDLIRHLRRRDREDWRALALEARLHFQAERHARAADCAVRSLALVYTQPRMHRLLGLALLHRGDLAGAERELRVALAQAPEFAEAHAGLAALLRRDPARLGEASLHMARAEQARLRVRLPAATIAPERDTAPPNPLPPWERLAPPPTGRAGIVTVVTGLPRSGTSMMMQILGAAGLPAFTDGERVPDSDNPFGYFEHTAAAALHRESGWLAAASGRAVKIVAPLLPYLPAGLSYRLVFLHRPLAQVVASQRAMLVRLGRFGAGRDEAALIRSFATQMARVRTWLERREDLPVLAIDYNAALADPAAMAVRLEAFLGTPFDTAAAAAAVAPGLRRQGNGG